MHKWKREGHFSDKTDWSYEVAAYLGKLAPKISFCPYFLQLCPSSTWPSRPLAEQTRTLSLHFGNVFLQTNIRKLRSLSNSKFNERIKKTENYWSTVGGLKCLPLPGCIFVAFLILWETTGIWALSYWGSENRGMKWRRFLSAGFWQSLYFL